MTGEPLLRTLPITVKMDKPQNLPKTTLLSGTLRHATRLSFLPSIAKRGLLPSFYGLIHGEMEHRPPAPAVYLSTSENSDNLHCELFNTTDDDAVVILEIDASLLDPAMVFPDDAFLCKVERDYCDGFDLETDDAEETIDDLSPSFSAEFGIPLERSRDLLRRFLLCDGSLGQMAEIASETGVEYLRSQGECAYLASVPPKAILSWRFHPKFKDSDIPRPTTLRFPMIPLACDAESDSLQSARLAGPLPSRALK